MKTLLKKYLPPSLILWYHYTLSLCGALVYGLPSRSLIIIGVTGTKGKTSTAHFIWNVLNVAGYKTGLISTSTLSVGDKVSLNEYHMTMPGRWVIQRMLARMKKEGCTHCVLEVTSEGIKQFRNNGVDVDIAVFTNLTPEHLPSHGGSFETYKATKRKLFDSLRLSYKKQLHGRWIKKVSIVNCDSEHANYFLSCWADKHITYGTKQGADIRVDAIMPSNNGVTFAVQGVTFELSVLGAFNVLNALPAVIVGRLFQVSDSVIAQGLKALSMIPGRMERIEEGQLYTVLVDYAHEAQSMNAVLDAARMITTQNGKVIVLLGAEGGGRDTSKRKAMGIIAAQKADCVIVSNVDPYEDDPLPILEDIAQAARANGKKDQHNLYVIEDRREGIRKALSLAHAQDIVVITGKGAEQSLCIAGKTFPWDDRVVVREELARLREKRYV